MDKNQMKKKLLEASNAYYNKSNPIMTDKEFDELRDKFEELYPNDPFLKTIGAPVDPASKWEKAEHKIPMGSLNKVTNLDEFYKWAKSVNSEKQLVLSEKLDGISIDCEYKNGKLVRAITRGDGKVGENITQNVKNMQGVLKELPGNYTGSFRGEIILKSKDFENIVEIQKSRQEEPIKNLRNGASGLAKRYDGKYSEYLTIIYYDLTGNYFTKIQKFNALEGLGLETSLIVSSPLITDEVIEIWQKYENYRRAELDYEIDGLVVEVNDLQKYKDLGELNGRPKGSVAFKFASIKKETVIKDVEWSIGNSGHITPVAILRPVKLGGVTVSRASLHNIEMIEKLDLREGDLVIVSRRNDVIPYVEGLADPGNIRSRGFGFPPPENCPACGERTKQDGKFLVCSNEMCGAKELGNLKKWIKSLDLKGIADKTIEKLYELKLIKTPADFYWLIEDDISNIEGFGKRSAEIIINTINNKRKITLPEFIAGLNIKNFGKRMTEILVKNGFDTLEKIRELSANDLVKIEGIKEKTAIPFTEEIKQKESLIDELLEVVEIRTNKKVESSEGLSGKSFCFTGKVEVKDENGERYTRKKLQELVKENGGEVRKSVSNGLDYLVQADPTSESNKSKKARKLGTKIISDQEFLEIIKK